MGLPRTIRRRRSAGVAVPYRLLFHALLRRLPAERVHQDAFAALRLVRAVPGVAWAQRRVLSVSDPAVRVRVWGRELSGPLGLAAGFDKQGVGVDAFAALGFGHVEIGTVTAQPQAGNPTPRLFRLTDDRAIVNRMGFNNDGAGAVAARLDRRARRASRANLASRSRNGSVMVGVNVGKTKVVPDEEAVADYVASTRALAEYADYLVVNVSSPNTPGLRDLQAVDRLRPLLLAVRAALDEQAQTRSGRPVPLLVKIAPDLADADIDAAADLAVELGLDGIVATNTTTRRTGLVSDQDVIDAVGPGGLSGAPLKQRSLDVLRRLHARVGDRLVLVSVGGIETVDDAWDRVRAGATLVQAYTGFIYGGPLWPRRVQRGLAQKLRAHGYGHLVDAVGTG